LPPTHGLPHIQKGKRLTKQEQQVFAQAVAQQYLQGATIRALADESGRSYGSIHRILAEDPGVQLRPRGGAYHHDGRRKKQDTVR
jgi:Helix-turn-helix domain